MTLKLPAPPSRVRVQPTQQITERRHDDGIKRPGTYTTVGSLAGMSVSNEIVADSE